MKGAELVVTSEDVVVSVVVPPVTGRLEALRVLLGLGILYVNKLLVRTRGAGISGLSEEAVLENARVVEGQVREGLAAGAGVHRGGVQAHT